MEQTTVSDLIDLKYRYDIEPSRDAPTNQQAAKQGIETFVCPSTGGRSGNQDANGYGYTDYSAPVTVKPGLSGNPNQPRFKCALNGDSDRRIKSITEERVTLSQSRRTLATLMWIEVASWSSRRKAWTMGLR